jgi:predicted small metal-binding protein
MNGQTIECPCGTVLRGSDEAAVVAEAQAHAREVHDMDLTDEQARSMIAPS